MCADMTAEITGNPKRHEPDKPPHNGLETVCFDAIQTKPVQWLWPDRVALGKLTVIAGNPGLGKSQITCAMAAAVTSHQFNWPDGAKASVKGSVLFISAEDDPADTIKPRLIAAGANVSRCHILGPGAWLDLSKDLKKLRATLEKHEDLRLVIIDPVSAYMGKMDSNNNAETRSMLSPLTELAAEMGVTIVLVTHLNKATNQDPIGRVIGSIGLVAAVRACYVVMRDEKDHAKRFFLPLKNNLGDDKHGLGFTITPVTVDESISTSKVEWAASLVNAGDFLSSQQNAGQPDRLSDAARWLCEELEDGKPHSAGEVRQKAEAAGFTGSSIERARKRLGVRTRKISMDEGWVWTLPNNEGNGAEDSEDFEELGHTGAISSQCYAKNHSEDDSEVFIL